MTKKLILIIHGVILVALWTLALLTDGTGGGGDSLTHFFFAQLSWQEPANFFNHWGKPFYTILASPWAQFGFTGVKLFNILCGVSSSLLASLAAIRLAKPWPWAIPILAFITPGYYTFLFSGFTEPVSALAVIGAIYLCLSGRVGWGFFLASFLPFCRSEAQIFLLFFFIFALFNGHLKKTPLLLAGYVIMGSIGSFFHDSFWWIFQTPYHPTSSVYGSGEWLHYIYQMEDMIALPFMILGGLGLVQFIRKAFVLKTFDWKGELWLVHGIFFSLLFGHTLVWALGIYGSAGLSRTLITVFPLLWLIMLDGLILLKDISAYVFRKQSYILPLTVIGIQIWLVITSPLSKYYFNNHIKLNPEDRFINSEIKPFIKDNYPEVRHFVIDNPYLAVALDINFINLEQRTNWYWYNKPNDIPDDALFIFDQQYITVQYGITLEQVRNNERLQEITEWTSPGGLNYVLFKKRPSTKS